MLPFHLGKKARNLQRICKNKDFSLLKSKFRLAFILRNGIQVELLIVPVRKTWVFPVEDIINTQKIRFIQSIILEKQN